MGARIDDLAPLLAAGPNTGVGFRQGVIMSWDTTTAANTVDVGGTLLVDLPILNTSEATVLTAGDVVGILTTGASWFILGRVTIPNTPAAASALAAVFSRIAAASDVSGGTRTPDTYGDLTGAAVGPSVTVNISSAGRALVFWSADYGGTGTWKRITTGGTSVEVSGATTRAPSGDYSLGHFFEFPSSGNPGDALVAGGIQNAMAYLFENLNPGANTFTLKYRNRENASPTNFSNRQIAVFAM